MTTDSEASDPIDWDAELAAMMSRRDAPQLPAQRRRTGNAGAVLATESYNLGLDFPQNIGLFLYRDAGWGAAATFIHQVRGLNVTSLDDRELDAIIDATELPEEWIEAMAASIESVCDGDHEQALQCLAPVQRAFSAGHVDAGKLMYLAARAQVSLCDSQRATQVAAALSWTKSAVEALVCADSGGLRYVSGYLDGQFMYSPARCQGVDIDRLLLRSRVTGVPQGMQWPQLALRLPSHPDHYFADRPQLLDLRALLRRLASRRPGLDPRLEVSSQAQEFRVHGRGSLATNLCVEVVVACDRREKSLDSRRHISRHGQAGILVRTPLGTLLATARTYDIDRGDAGLLRRMEPQLETVPIAVYLDCGDDFIEEVSQVVVGAIAG